MAKKDSKKPTVRESITKKTGAKPKRRLPRGYLKNSKRLNRAKEIGKLEYHLPLPDNKLGRFLSKRGRIVPRYIREAWAEIKQVTWPSRRETTRLTTAVFIFSVVFGVLVALLDIGLDKLFKVLIIK